MLMTPARQQRKASKTCKLNWRNKKQPAAVAPRKGNCATGCHFRPYSFASSPFDDFAEMKNSTRKIVCQPLSAPPLDGPPTTAEITFRKGSKGKRRSLLATRGAAARLAGATALRPSFPHTQSPRGPSIRANCGAAIRRQRGTLYQESIIFRHCRVCAA